MNRKIFSVIFVAAFLYVASPLILPVAMGGVFAVLFFPWLKALEKRRFSTRASATLVTIGVTLCLLLPMALFTFFAVKTGLQQVRLWKDAPRAGGNLMDSLVHVPGIRSILEGLSHWFPASVEELSSAAADIVRTAGVRLADWLAEAVRQIPSALMGLTIMVFSTFFLLADGRRLVLFIRENSVFSRRQTERFIHSFASMCRSVILASVISGLVQGSVYGLGCALIAGLNGLLIGFLIFIASFVPLVGSAPITFGVGLQQLLAGQKAAGIVLLVLAVILAFIDNLIRPMVLKGRSNLHPLLGFVAAFGGLQTLGFSGVFLGPILAGLFAVTVKNLVQEDED